MKNNVDVENAKMKTASKTEMRTKTRGTTLLALFRDCVKHTQRGGRGIFV